MSHAREPDGNAVTRVLLVDDTAVIRMVIRRTLELDGRFEVVGEACNGAEGVELTERLQPDLVLLDLAMPVMDGLEALPHIRPHSTVIVLSAFSGDQMGEQVCEAGALCYIEKEHLASRLVPAIVDALGVAERSTPLLRR